jgi:hypothetical protein
MENKNILQKRSFIDQEWHLVLEMSASEMTHARRGKERTHMQNNIKVKPEQLKLRKTYSSTWP